MTTLDRTIVWASDSAGRILGWQSIDIQGSVLYQFIHPGDRPLAIAARAELDAGFPAAFVFRFQSEFGDYRLVEALARPVLASETAVVAFLGEFRPATSGTKAEPAPPQSIRITPPSPPHLG